MIDGGGGGKASTTGWPWLAPLINFGGLELEMHLLMQRSEPAVVQAKFGCLKLPGCIH